MTDRMDQIVEAAEQQGFEVRQTAEATWIFRKGLNTIIQPRPASAAEWLSFVAALRELGLAFPPE
jgi:hypothetical protein